MSWFKGKEPFIIIIVGVILLSISKYFEPVPINWSPNFSEEGKIPYGNYLIAELIQPIFPGSEVSTNNESIYNFLNSFLKRDIDQANLIIINFFPEITYNGSFKTFTKFDIKKLLAFVDAGNTAFIADHSFPEALSDTLSFETYQNFHFKNDSHTVKFNTPNLNDEFLIENRLIKQHFENVDEYKSNILATVTYKHEETEHPILLKQSFGEGQFIISATPHLFTNYNMVTGNGHQFISTAFSHLPNQHTFWDEYYKPNKIGVSNSPLRFVLSQKSLKWAIYLTVISLLFYIFFKSKRLQRIIPVIKPLPNLSLDFTKTIGMLYFHKRDNADIAKKRVKYCLAFIRKKYFLNTNILDDAFTNKLIAKSGMEQKEASILINYMNTAKNSNNLSDEVLLRLNQFIDKFYKAAKN